MTSEKPRRLGRGLEALLATRPAAPLPATTVAEGAAVEDGGAEQPGEATVGGRTLRSVPIAQIRANPYQPRKDFRPEELADLEASLKATGLLQPITVRPAAAGGFELIAGERRLRAATQAGWTEIRPWSRSSTTRRCSPWHSSRTSSVLTSTRSRKPRGTSG
jgi:ParB family chromosome partitioning protein